MIRVLAQDLAQPRGVSRSIATARNRPSTVTGMIEAFEAITTQGVGDARVLSGGIGEALITTAAGLMVAIPALIGYRYLQGLVDGLVVEMEKEAIKLVQAFDRLGVQA